MFLSSNALMVKPNPLCPDFFRFGVSLAFKKLSFFGALDEIVNIVEYIYIYIYFTNLWEVWYHNQKKKKSFLAELKSYLWKNENEKA